METYKDVKLKIKKYSADFSPYGNRAIDKIFKKSDYSGMSKKYTADFFIDFFESIPKRQWCTFTFVDDDGRKCVLGHCGVRNFGESTEMSRALNKQFAKLKLFPTVVNDSFRIDLRDLNEIFPSPKNNDYEKWGKHPRDRVIYALKKIKRVGKKAKTKAKTKVKV